MTILCFAEDPGGANGIISLASQSDEIIIHAQKSAEKYILDHGLKISGHNANTISNSVRAIVVGTTNTPDSKAFDYIKQAKDRGIKSFGYVDAGVNAQHRFKGHSENPLEHAPDILFVTEQATANAFVELGFDASRIYNVGNPRYDYVQNRAKSLIKEKRERKRILFLATPINVPVGDQYKQSGFNAQSANDVRSYLVLDCVLECLAEEKLNAEILIKLHPRNTADEFARYKGECTIYNGDDIGIDLAFQSDVVTGTATSLMAEAALINIPTITALLTEKERTWLPDIVPDNLIISTKANHFKHQLKNLLRENIPFPPASNKDELCKQAGETMLKMINSHCKNRK